MVTSRDRPGRTAEAREDELIALAYNVAEEQMRNGTASAQVISHFLKLGSIKAQQELELLTAQTELAHAKVESIQRSDNMEELVAKAAESMVSYGANVFKD